MHIQWIGTYKKLLKRIIVDEEETYDASEKHEKSFGVRAQIGASPR
jgi:hypothetical protein